MSGETVFKGPYFAQSVEDAVFVWFSFSTNQAGEGLDNDFSRWHDKNPSSSSRRRQMAGEIAKWR